MSDGQDAAVPRSPSPSQANEPFDEPDRERIPRISRAHVAAMEAADPSVWTVKGMEHLLLRTVGRRSGREHKVALPFWVDPGGARVVVASFAGAPQHPAWYLNLLDASVNGRVLVTVREGPYWARPEVLDGADYDRTWALLVADRPYYDGYRARTERRIPLVRLRQVAPA